MPRKTLNRRTLLRGAGVSMALPLLEAMMPKPSLAKSTSTPQASPVRMAFFYIPNGVIMPNWLPTGSGSAFSLSPTLEPFSGLRDEISIIHGLHHRNGEVMTDGAGDHARASGSYLSGARPLKSATQARAGITVDQRAAEVVGTSTRLPSLELTCDRGQTVGSCDSGYNCAYQATISWRNEVSPRPAEVDPRAVFERLFSDGMLSPKERQARKRADRSVLDFAKSDLSRLTRDVGAADQQKLDEYLTAVRSVESLIARSESFPLPKLPPGSRKPPNYPRNYEEHVGMMTELMRLAFLTDSTRVATFMLSREGVGEKFPDLGGNEVHHEISHHQNNPDKIAILKRIDLMHAQLVAKAFESFAQTKEGDKSLLDNTMMVFGSGLSDGNAHLHTNLPTLVAGRAGGKLVPQGFVKLSKPAPMCNLWLSLLNNMGVQDKIFGDSQGVLPGFAV